jgi:hypothetical protein
VKIRRTRYVAASDIARLGYCEQQIAFDERIGPVTTPQQRARRESGKAAHATFHSDAMERQSASGASTDNRCFVATLVFGPDAPETIALRQYRDQSLMKYRSGRGAVAIYYRLSPGLCRLMRERPRLIRCVRWMLENVVRALGTGRAP